MKRAKRQNRRGIPGSRQHDARRNCVSKVSLGILLITSSTNVHGAPRLQIGSGPCEPHQLCFSQVVSSYSSVASFRQQPAIGYVPASYLMDRLRTFSSAALLIMSRRQGPFGPALRSGPHCCFRRAKGSTLTCRACVVLAADRLTE